jgi:hypothetical protein
VKAWGQDSAWGIPLLPATSVWHWAWGLSGVFLPVGRSVGHQVWPVDYGIGCHYDAAQDRLLLSAGNNQGEVVMAQVLPDAIHPFLQVKKRGGDKRAFGGKRVLCAWRERSVISVSCLRGRDVLSVTCKTVCLCLYCCGVERCVCLCVNAAAGGPSGGGAGGGLCARLVCHGRGGRADLCV